MREKMLVFSKIAKGGGQKDKHQICRTRTRIRAWDMAARVPEGDDGLRCVFPDGVMRSIKHSKQ